MAGMEPMLYVNNAFVAAAPGHIIVKNFLLFIAERSDEFIDDWDPDDDVEEKDNLVVSQTGPIAFSSIMFTYFGVNFYLSGLHSYQSGQQIASFQIIVIACVLVAILAFFAHRKYVKFYKK